MGRRWTYRPPSFRAWINKLRRRPVGAEGELPIEPGAPVLVGIRRLRKDELVSYGLRAGATVQALLRSYETVSLSGFSSGATVSHRRLRIDPVTSFKLRK
jgi:hypothetical protein